MVTVPVPCNLVQMSLTAKAIQNSNTIPKITYTTYGRSFFKLHLFTLQSVTTKRVIPKLPGTGSNPAVVSHHTHPPPAGFGRIFNAKRFVTPPCCARASHLPPRWHGTGVSGGRWQLCSAGTRSLPLLPAAVGLQR